MNKRFLKLVGVAAVLSVGTYVGLNIVKPYTQEEVKVADTTPADQVFAGSVSNPEPHPEAEGAAAAAPAAADAATAAPAAESAAVVQPADTSVQPSADAAPAPATPAEAAPAAATAEPAAPAAAEPQTAAAEPAPAAAAPEPAAAEPAAAPAEAPAPAPVEKPKKRVAKKSEHKAVSVHASKAWWPAETPSQLSLVYAGPASFKQAIVLMFNGAFFQADGVNANIKVTGKDGKAIAGAWELGENNRRMLVFPVPAAGTYKVSVAPDLTDSKGRKLGTHLGGPVQIH
jgi:hypothetical protein